MSTLQKRIDAVRAHRGDADPEPWLQAIIEPGFDDGEPDLWQFIDTRTGEEVEATPARIARATRELRSGAPVRVVFEAVEP